jgi:chemotaxis methyl-accepting protein methylase
MSRTPTGSKMSDRGHQAELGQDLLRLRQLLEKAITPIKATSLAGKPDVSVLNVACGACDEAGTLSDFFGSLTRTGDDPPAKTLLVGTDVRERELAQARARFPGSSRREFEFFKGDASKLRGHRQLRDVFDIVFFRHQNLYNGRRLWRQIFEQALDRLEDHGLLVITSYFDREHALALKAFDELGAELVTTVRHRDARALPTPGKSVDRHLAVLRRR